VGVFIFFAGITSYDAVKEYGLEGLRQSPVLEMPFFAPEALIALFGTLLFFYLEDILRYFETSL
jgi:hypothetical protein